jgi:hypothetical protein
MTDQYDDQQRRETFIEEPVKKRPRLQGIRRKSKKEGLSADLSKKKLALESRRFPSNGTKICA